MLLGSTFPVYNSIDCDICLFIPHPVDKLHTRIQQDAVAVCCVTGCCNSGLLFQLLVCALVVAVVVSWLLLRWWMLSQKGYRCCS